MEQKILEKLKMVKFGDLIHIFKFLFALLPAMFFRKKHKDLWLICDYEMVCVLSIGMTKVQK